MNQQKANLSIYYELQKEDEIKRLQKEEEISKINNLDKSNKQKKDNIQQTKSIPINDDFDDLCDFYLNINNNKITPTMQPISEDINVSIELEENDNITKEPDIEDTKIKDTLIPSETADLKVLLPSDSEFLDTCDNEFNNLIRITDKEEAKKIKEYIGLFIKKKRDYKFTVQPVYNTLFELATNYCSQVVPIIKYIILRFNEQNLATYRDRMIKITQSVDTDKIVTYYNKLNGNLYGKTIIYNKLNGIMEDNEKKIHVILLLIYSLLPFKDKPIKPGTIGVSESEFEDLYNEQ